MLIYKFEWKKGNKKGSFKVYGTTDEECVKDGHEEIERFGGEVVDYYQISPSTGKLFDKLMNLKTKSH